MSKFPEYTHEKSAEWFQRALNAIPSGVYGHLGPSRGIIPSDYKMAFNVTESKGYIFLGC